MELLLQHLLPMVVFLGTILLILSGFLLKIRVWNLLCMQNYMVLCEKWKLLLQRIGQIFGQKSIQLLWFKILLWCLGGLGIDGSIAPFSLKA
jgi:hypothetical protein